MEIYNLFESPNGSGEDIYPLLKGASFSLEHIVSRGAVSEPDYWYDQPQDEWVALIRGTATLEFKSQPCLELKTGDALLIPAHCEHRVAENSKDAHWIALHFDR